MRRMVFAVFTKVRMYVYTLLCTMTNLCSLRHLTSFRECLQPSSVFIVYTCVMLIQPQLVQCHTAGLVPSLLYIAPQAGLYFGFYHGLMQLWQHTSTLHVTTTTQLPCTCNTE